jgi:hypothetical protein
VWNAIELAGTEPTASASLGFDGGQVVVLDDRNGVDAVLTRYTFSTE